MFWGTTGIFVDGVVDLRYRSDHGTVPGGRTRREDRERYGLPILIAARDGIPTLESGAINHTVLVTFQAVTSVPDHGISPGEAARQPFFFGPAGPVTGESPWDWFRAAGLIGNGFPADVIDGLRRSRLPGRRDSGSA